MDKSWISKSRLSEEYENGVDMFLDFAFNNVSYEDKIICPCVRCGLIFPVTRPTCYDHLMADGFMESYTSWILHGESPSSMTTESPTSTNNEPVMHMDTNELLHDAFGVPLDNLGGDLHDREQSGEEPSGEEPNESAKKFYDLLNDGQKELFPGSKNSTKLSFILEIFHIKCLGGWSNNSFTMLLELLHKTFPGILLPKKFYEVDKLIKSLGLSYEKIHACPNDCLLYRKEFKDDLECNVCHESRYLKNDGNDGDSSNGASSSITTKIPAKVLHYFPLIPRLQRLFMSSKTASSMRWHKEGRTKDGCMRHPADSPAWKTFDHVNSDFSADCRNVRLGLASDGMNPFKTMSTTHSTWPVVLVHYNMEPSECLKQTNLIVSMIIPGPNSPGNNIDVYLQPLIDELQELWSNVEASQFGALADQLNGVEASQFGALAEQLNGDEDGNNTIRRTRGPTFMTDIWGVRDDERLEVGWNEFGQPDDKLGTKLSCFIGTIIRDGKKAPIHHKDWHNVPQKCKDDIWDLVQTKFNVPSPYRKWVMHCASKKLRSWKATLKRKFYSENLSIEEQMHYKDKRVYTEQWLKLIEHWKTEEAKGQSATNKKSRYQKKYNHTTGTKSFSRIRKEENVKLGHCPSRARMFKVCYTKKNGTSEATKNMIEQIDDKMAADESLIHEGASPNDLFAQVMGKEKNGHVRTYGLGVAPTDLWKDAYGCRAEKKAMAESMQNELIHLRSQVQELRSLFIQGSNTTTLRQIPGVYNSTLAEHQSTPYFTETQNTQPVQVGEEVVLKSISRPSQTVAIGILHSKDASKQVDGMELGPDFWEIHIQVPVEHNERLVRAYANMRTIGQAAGALVAWPIPFVISQAVDASRNYVSMDSSAS